MEEIKTVGLGLDIVNNALHYFLQNRRDILVLSTHYNFADHHDIVDKLDKQYPYIVMSLAKDEIHQVACIVNTRSKKIAIIDSQNGSKASVFIEKFPGYTVEIKPVPEALKQKDNYSCGIHVIKNILRELEIDLIIDERAVLRVSRFYAEHQYLQTMRAREEENKKNYTNQYSKSHYHKLPLEISGFVNEHLDAFKTIREKKYFLKLWATKKTEFFLQDWDFFKNHVSERYLNATKDFEGMLNNQLQLAFYILDESERLSNARFTKEAEYKKAQEKEKIDLLNKISAGLDLEKIKDRLQLLEKRELGFIKKISLEKWRYFIMGNCDSLLAENFLELSVVVRVINSGTERMQLCNANLNIIPDEKIAFIFSIMEWHDFLLFFKEFIYSKNNFSFEKMAIFLNEIPEDKKMISIDLLKKHLKNGSDLFQILKILPEDNRFGFAEEMSGIIKNFGEAFSILNELPENKAFDFINRMRALVTNAEQLMALLLKLPKDTAASLIDNMKQVIKNGNDLQNILACSPMEIRFAVANNMRNVIQDGHELAVVLARLPENNYFYFINGMKDVIKDGHQLSAVLKAMAEHERLDFLNSMKDLIQDGLQLVAILFSIKKDNRLNFVLNLKNVIRNEDELLTIYRYLPDNTKINFLQEMGALIREKIGIYSIMRELPGELQSVFLDAIIQDGYQLANFLNSLPKSEFAEFDEKSFRTKQFHLAIKLHGKIKDSMQLEAVKNAFFRGNEKKYFDETIREKIGEFSAKETLSLFKTTRTAKENNNEGNSDTAEQDASKRGNGPGIS